MTNRNFFLALLLLGSAVATLQGLPMDPVRKASAGSEERVAEHSAMAARARASEARGTVAEISETTEVIPHSNIPVTEPSVPTAITSKEIDSTSSYSENFLESLVTNERAQRSSTLSSETKDPTQETLKREYQNDRVTSSDEWEEEKQEVENVPSLFHQGAPQKNIEKLALSESIPPGWTSLTGSQKRSEIAARWAQAKKEEATVFEDVSRTMIANCIERAEWWKVTFEKAEKVKKAWAEIAALYQYEKENPPYWVKYCWLNELQIAEYKKAY